MTTDIETAIPTYEVEATGAGHVVRFVKPCLCGERHTHGAPGLKKGKRTHRVAHCRDLQVHSNGYYIKLKTVR